MVQACAMDAETPPEETPEETDSRELRAERAWMGRHRVEAWPLERAMPCLRPALPADLADPTAPLLFRDRQGRLGVYLAAVLARPPAHGRQQLLGALDRPTLARQPSSDPRPFGVFREQPRG